MAPQARETAPTPDTEAASGAPARTPPASMSDASVSAGLDPVEIRVYRFTGAYGPLRVPKDWCRECDLFIRAADQAADQAPVEVDVTVIPWITHPVGALWYGGWHPPVMVLDGELIAQGYDVPSVDRVLDHIKAAAADRFAQEETG